MPGASRKLCNDLSKGKQQFALFKAAWAPFHEDAFNCSSDHHVLCRPLSAVLCKCDDQPRVMPENVDLRTYEGPLSLVVQPSLPDNTPLLDLLHHTALLHPGQSAPVLVTTTFAEVAASAGNVNLLQHLFTSSDQCVRQFYQEYYSYRDPDCLLKLFVHALNGGSRDVVLYLMGNFVDELTSNVKISILESCLWLATTDKTLELLFQELVQKFGVNLIDGSGDFTPLMLTCFYDNSSMAEYLVDAGADMYAETSDGCTVAYSAYKYGGFIGQHAVLKALLYKGLCVDAVLKAHSAYFQFPLMYTFIHHNEQGLVHLLVECGYSVDKPICFRADSREHEVTPLMHALACRHFELATWLVEKGANCNTASFHSQRLEDESWTPLHMAASQGDLPMVKTLVEHGGQIQALTDSGETVLCLAASMDVSTYLLQINAPVQCIPGSSFRVKCREETGGQQQWSMLDLAVFDGNILLTEALLQSRHYQHPPRLAPFLCKSVPLRSENQVQAMQCVQQFSAEVCTLRVTSLQVLCRDTLRQACGTRLLRYVRATTMPARLRSLLLLEDILGPIETCKENQEETTNSL